MLKYGNAVLFEIWKRTQLFSAAMASRHLRSAWTLVTNSTHRTTAATGPSLRCGDVGFSHLHWPRINPNSLTDSGRLVCYAALHA
jgi:hypothetical protein